MALLKPLLGLHLLLTRTPEDCALWEPRLAAAGASTTRVPCIRAEPIDTPETRSRLMASLETTDWLILTSRRGVEAMVALRPRPGLPPGVQVAAVGMATGGMAETRLGRIDLVSSGGTAASLARELVEDAAFTAGQRCLAVLAENAGATLQSILESAGAEFTRVDVYRTIPLPVPDEKRSLASMKADVVVFSSPTAVEGFMNQIDIDTDCQAYSIGPSTSRAIRAAGLPLAGEAAEPNLGSLIEIIGSTARRAFETDGGS